MNKCEKCSGTGQIKEGKRSVICPTCDGHGHIADDQLAYLKNRTFSESHLWNTILDNDLTKVRQVLKNDTTDLEEMDDNGITPLIYAAQMGFFSIVKALVAKGANIQARDNNGRTALMWASLHKYNTIIEYLVKNGADVNAIDLEGDTPLFYARTGHPEEGKQETVKLLEKLGAKNKN
jgi:ankyrin repeat protein